MPAHPRPDYRDRVEACKRLILANLAAGRHHYHHAYGRGFANSGDPAIHARIELVVLGHIERVPPEESGTVFATFRLTELGRAALGGDAAARKETVS